MFYLLFKSTCNGLMYGDGSSFNFNNLSRTPIYVDTSVHSDHPSVSICKYLYFTK